MEKQMFAADALWEMYHDAVEAKDNAFESDDLSYDEKLDELMLIIKEMARRNLTIWIL